MSKRYEPTPEQIALSQERKARANKAKLAAEKVAVLATAPGVEEDKGRIVDRKWIQLQPTDNQESSVRRVKVMTWNLLAQTLIRRELFPASDCLKASQREHMLYNEILSQKADIICMQEVDRLEKLLPVLEGAGYSHAFAAGPKKRHGCLIAYDKAKYTKVEERTVFYDEQEIRSDGDDRARHGSSFRTKNIGFIAALKQTDAQRGIIVATTHLFWHPRYTYERARQAGILVREVLQFRKANGLDDWPCIISGDFNFAPDDPAYSLLVGEPLLLAQEERLRSSRVVHLSIDPEIALATAKLQQEDEESGETDPDRIITNARTAKPSDGLLTNAELVELFTTPLRSAYDEGTQIQREISKDVTSYGDRVPLAVGRKGANEPEWTSYTHYWKTVLDYIFVLDSPRNPSKIIGFAQPLSTKDLDPGIPRKGVCGSDHISLTAEIVL